MSNCRKFSLISLISCTFLFPLACKDKKPPPEKDIVKHVATLSERVSEDLQKTVQYLEKNNGKLNDSLTIAYLNLTDSIYQNNNYQTIWSRDDHWLPFGDSLFSFIDSSRDYGLFPEDYHQQALSFIHRIFLADSLGRKNAALWARADLLLTDAFFTLVKHIKQGRLKYDSVTLRTDTTLPKEIFMQSLSNVIQSGSVRPTLEILEPKYPGYDSLRRYIKEFLAKAEFKPFTYLVYPYKDSVAFFHLLERRLHEIGILQPKAENLDTLAFQRAVRKYQRLQNYKATGYLSDPLVDKLNDTDWERFKRIAVNLDRYKLLPDTLPTTYVWVNLPEFTLRVMNDDTLVFQSRIIVGQPQTRTPLLTSEISNFITYPQWTVPYSIIFKEMLPKIQEDVEFLNKENLMVVDANDSVLDPHNINWEKLNKNHFPYLIKQKQGDDNSLGVIKFNFRNKYSVYMHDTNVRWMFGKSFRALSHGCVRVKEWKKMANFLIRNDTLKYHPDTLRAWIGRQEKHVVSGFAKVPVFIRYFSCEGKGGRIKFYDDIYEEDRYLTEKYFGNKTVEE
jgi:murein L,D-transpeptidase YcbB/YkuD